MNEWKAYSTNLECIIIKLRSKYGLSWAITFGSPRSNISVYYYSRDLITNGFLDQPQKGGTTTSIWRNPTSDSCSSLQGEQYAHLFSIRKRLLTHPLWSILQPPMDSAFHLIHKTKSTCKHPWHNAVKLTSKHTSIDMKLIASLHVNSWK